MECRHGHEIVRGEKEREEKGICICCGDYFGGFGCPKSLKQCRNCSVVEDCSDEELMWFIPSGRGYSPMSVADWVLKWIRKNQVDHPPREFVEGPPLSIQIAVNKRQVAAGQNWPVPEAVFLGWAASHKNR